MRQQAARGQRRLRSLCLVWSRNRDRRSALRPDVGEEGDGGKCAGVRLYNNGPSHSVGFAKRPKGGQAGDPKRRQVQGGDPGGAKGFWFVGCEPSGWRDRRFAGTMAVVCVCVCQWIASKELSSLGGPSRVFVCVVCVSQRPRLNDSRPQQAGSGRVFIEGLMRGGGGGSLMRAAACRQAAVGACSEGVSDTANSGQGACRRCGYTRRHQFCVCVADSSQWAGAAFPCYL